MAKERDRCDSIGGLVAALDQLKAALVDVAHILGGYQRQLIEAGFDRDDALELCLQLQRVVICGDDEASE